MTKLSTHIPLEVIKQNKKLQEIKCRDYYQKTQPYNIFEISSHVPSKISFEMEEAYSAPTIYNIIDNAEELFVKGKFEYNYSRYSVKHYIDKIIKKCLQNKSIEEISEYIIKNIK